MVDWDHLLSRPQMVCALTGEAIAPGSTFYSLLRWQGSHFQRVDISEGSWNEDLINGCVSWWRQSRAEEKEAEGPQLLNPEILYGIFRDCAKSEERPRQCLAWLLAWLLVRLRFLRFIDLETFKEIDSPDRLHVQTKVSRGKERLRLRDPQMNKEEESLVQAQIDDLFTMGGNETI
jgi:hypothetical protein